MRPDEKLINQGIDRDPDTYVPSDDEFSHALSTDKLPDAARKAIDGVRGKQKKPRKVSTTIRLSAEVLDYYKGGGKGWQSRIDMDLRRNIHKDDSASSGHFVGRDSKAAGGAFVKRDSKSGQLLSDNTETEEKKRA